MKVLIADLFSPAGIDQLKAAGLDVTYDDKLNGESLVAALGEHKPNVLVVRSTKVPKEAIDADPSLQLVVRAGAGYDTIDVAHCSKMGVFVANCPGKNATAVAELAFGLMLSIDRKMADGVQWLNEGKWKKGQFASCLGLKHRTLGLVGFGNIGQLVAKRAIAFEMNVLVHTRTQDDELAKSVGFKYASSLDDLLANSDVVSFHVPSTPETKGMINKDLLGKMKPNAVLINTARGNIVNDDDLFNHLEETKSFWYGTDVFNGEPAGKEADFDNRIAKHPRCYGTHHCGASTKQAESEIGQEAVRIILKFGSTGKVDEGNCVNKDKKQSDLWSVSIRHKDKAGVLAFVFTEAAKAGWNVQGLENIPLNGRDACVASFTFSIEGGNNNLAATIEELKKNEAVYDVIVNN